MSSESDSFVSAPQRASNCGSSSRKVAAHCWLPLAQLAQGTSGILTRQRFTGFSGCLPRCVVSGPLTSIHFSLFMAEVQYGPHHYKLCMASKCYVIFGRIWEQSKSNKAQF